MLLSMTGYGRATHDANNKSYTVEIRSLNTKQNDLRLRANLTLHQYEVKLRKQILDAVKRGKLDVSVEIKDESGGGAVRVNTNLLRRLYTEITENLPAGTDGTTHESGLYAALFRIPGVVESASERITDEDWAEVKAAATAAVQHLNEYRTQEGTAMASDLKDNCDTIKSLLLRVEDFEEQRIQSVRDRMERHLADYLGRGNVDKNRYEQEVLFYLEKMDINEEKVRLAQNCDYFVEILSNDDDVKGRKLNFISQEIGREINTLGAKGYSPEIQKLVVNMKEQLEMIKEQLANVA
ncbi:YicC/YloC family endoribonuclease [Lewinella sp. 4G2]|uniref:YicC/YloC family endoribonuclease n=1 Tax=Lewinella sp. 4G2 TaxID=1803372 RepID=UPI0007B47563|nr:YicC/YloC family endoribonuclease [Lewinella sp. 4G2]OAV42727.1 YicC family protein [Lewinella sp. 4G2]